MQFFSYDRRLAIVRIYIYSPLLMFANGNVKDNSISALIVSNSDHLLTITHYMERL